MRDKSERTAPELELEIDSAGTAGYHVGQSPDLRSIEVARLYSIDIGDQKARLLQVQDLDYFDLILCMDRSNMADVLALGEGRSHKAKVELLMSYSAGQRDEVPDPYWDDKGFELVYHMIDSACQSLLTQLSDHNRV